MARITEPTKKSQKEWAAWVASRPEPVRVVAERFDPWSLYRMKSTGQRVTVRSFYEDGTLSVNITGQFNLIDFDRWVFGVDPDDLDPCDLPGPDEPVGAMMSSQQVEDNIDALRVLIRPDLFQMGPDGKAMRKN